MNTNNFPAMGLLLALFTMLTIVAGGASADDSGVESYAFTDAALKELRGSLRQYEDARAALANDSLDGLKALGDGVALGVGRELESGKELPATIREELAAAVEAANALGSSEDLKSARLGFGELSESLVNLAAVDARLQEGLHVFLCPMAEGYQKWFQEAETLENPYMGPQMLRCGTGSEWSAADETPATEATHESGEPHDESHLHGDDEVAYYTCSMHPSVKEATPGTCPICNMNLTPVTRAEMETGVIMIDEVRRQRIGVKTGSVVRQPMRLEVRAVGKISYDETRLENVTLRTSGWIEELRVNETGQRVEQGQALFTVYSPDFYTAQEEYLQALRSQSNARGTGRPDRADGIVRAARQRLLLWSLDEREVDAIGERGTARETVTIRSPTSGYVIAKHVVEGDHVEAGQRLYEIAALDEVWVEAEVFEGDLPYVTKDQSVQVTLPYLPGRSFEGRVSYVYPYLDEGTRTGRVRVVLTNPELELRPGMYGTVSLEVELGERTQVPASAVVYTGPRRLVFLDLGEGRLRPQEVQVGAKNGAYYEVLGGLSPGDLVVTSGHFLVAAESRIKSALEYWSAADGD